MMRKRTIILATTTLLAACAAPEPAAGAPAANPVSDLDGKVVPPPRRRGEQAYPMDALYKEIQATCTLVYDIRNDGRTVGHCGACATGQLDAEITEAFTRMAISTVAGHRYPKTGVEPPEGIAYRRVSVELAWRFEGVPNPPPAPDLAGYCGLPADETEPSTETTPEG